MAVAVAGGAGVDLGKQVQEVGVAPLSTDRLAKARTQELVRGAGEEVLGIVAEF